MITQDEKRSQTLKRYGLILLNALLAGVIGYAAWGVPGGAIGAVACLVASASILVVARLIGQLGSNRQLTSQRSAANEALTAIAKLVAFPFVMVAAIIVTVFTLLVSLLLMGGTHVKETSGISMPNRVSSPRRRGRRPSTFFHGFGAPDNLAMLVGNLVLLLIIGCILFGIDVAFYAALVATPVWLLALMLIAIQGSNPNEPVPVPGGTPHTTEGVPMQGNTGPQ